MRWFRFKSLTMRIWATFTVVILAITVCMSLIYIYFFRVMDMAAKSQDLAVAHEILIDSDLDGPVRLDDMKNLRGVSHVIYKNDTVKHIGGGVNMGMQGGAQGVVRPEPLGRGEFAHRFNPLEIKSWINEFLAENSGGTIDKTVFHRNSGGIDLTFIISELDDGSYFISYMPNFYDNSMMYYMLAISGIFIIIGFITAKIIAGYLSKPLSQLERFTERIATRDWKEPIVLKNDDEIGRLGVSMNKMREALKRADEEEKMFLQSISHDLKTPVMVIMSHADAILDGVYIDTLDKTAQIIKDEAIRLNRKIKQLLYLNTLDYVLENQAEPSGVELGKLLKQTVGKLGVVGSRLKWDLDVDEVRVMGSAEKLTVAIENIIDNAIRYARTCISVSLKRDENSCKLEITNDGAHIKAENIGRIFDNMYKDKTGNFGLGLAITKKIISFFGGSVYAENIQDGEGCGVKFVVRYPMAN